jgi:hypothetical protein
MARYDLIWSALARRAVREGVTDIEAFSETALASGIPPDQLEERLIRDLEEGGPIFGKFTRSIEAAAGRAVVAAERQGEDVALARAEELISMAEMDDILEDADAEAIDELKRELAPKEMLMWVATLVNTCHLCLPLHGKIASREFWEEKGLDPENIHQNEGWSEKSRCQCHLIPAETEEVTEQMAPLVRGRVESATGLKGSKRTQRLVAQRDIEKAMAAVEKARESEEGRRTLRLMGETQADEVEEVEEEREAG